MAKNVKLQVKNTQLAEAINLSGLKAKLKKRAGEGESGAHEEAPHESASTGQAKSQVKAEDSSSEVSHQKQPLQEESQVASHKAAQKDASDDEGQARATPTAPKKAKDGAVRKADSRKSDTAKAEAEENVQARDISKTDSHEELLHEGRAPTQAEETESKSSRPARSKRKAESASSKEHLGEDAQSSFASDVATHPMPVESAAQEIVTRETAVNDQVEGQVLTPPKKIPTLPASMRAEESGGLRLGPVLDRPNLEKSQPRPNRTGQRNVSGGSSGTDSGKRPQQRPSDGKRPFGTAAAGQKPFEPFKDRAKGIQPFTTPLPKPAPRPRPEARTGFGSERRDFSRGDSPRDLPQRGGFDRGEPGAPSDRGGFRRANDERPSDDRPADSRPTEGLPREAYQSGMPPRDTSRPPRSDYPRPDYQPRSDYPRSDRPRPDYQPRSDQPRSDFPRSDYPRSDRPRPDYQPRSDQPRTDRPRTEYPPRTGDYQRPGGYARSGDAGSAPRSGPGGYPPRTGSAPGGGYQRSGESGGYPPRTNSGPGGYPPRTGERSFDRPRPPFAGGPRRETGPRIQPVIPPKEGGIVRQKPETRLPDKLVRPINKDAKNIKRPEGKEDARVRHGWSSAVDEDDVWRKKRPSKSSRYQNDVSEIIRPQSVSVRVPISVKDLADRMKLKASQLIAKLFLQGLILTLNDVLDDETTLQLLGSEFGCEISIDTRDEEKMRVTDKTLIEEISAIDQSNLIIRPPVVAFMGHVDHGKTSLIDSIRKSNRVQSEVGAITQHIGAFQCSTSHGQITILDTPGHEAFSSMRERGAEITDIVVLVVAGDEGMKEQTLEALNQARDAKTTIVIAINKCDKPAFDQEKVYRQLADNNLLPEAWGGQTVTVNCSAVSGEGISNLVEMLALQAEVLELKANPAARARGHVVESQVQKGLGSVSTLLVQNGTLRLGDCLIFDCEWAKVKTMRNELGREVAEAGPSTPVLITGLSDLPSAGEEFIVVASEKEAKEIAQMRREGRKQTIFMKKRQGLESMLQKGVAAKKVLNLILRADVQGSLEALKTALEKIASDKVEVNVISVAVGEISESDVQLAATSKATLIGFHTQIEAHAEPLIKALGVTVRDHNIIYHAVDDVREIMKGLLDKLSKEVDKGKAEVKAVFKSSTLGNIAGCQVLDGTISRNCHVRVTRAGKELWRGPISSLKRFKDDVREVQKGHECGIVLNGFSEVIAGDILEAFEVTYLTQEL